MARFVAVAPPGDVPLPSWNGALESPGGRHAGSGEGVVDRAELACPRCCRRSRRFRRCKRATSPRAHRPSGSCSRRRCSCWGRSEHSRTRWGWSPGRRGSSRPIARAGPVRRTGRVGGATHAAPAAGRGEAAGRAAADVVDAGVAGALRAGRTTQAGSFLHRRTNRRRRCNSSHPRTESPRCTSSGRRSRRRRRIHLGKPPACPPRRCRRCCTNPPA